MIVNFIRRCTKEHLCENCNETINKGDSYFNFIEYTDRTKYGRSSVYGESIKHPICFDCYKVKNENEQNERKLENVKSKLKEYDNDLSNLINGSEHLIKNLETLKDQILELELELQNKGFMK